MGINGNASREMRAVARRWQVFRDMQCEEVLDIYYVQVIANTYF